VISVTVLPFVLLVRMSENEMIANGIATIFFALLVLTDFFDGYIARKYKTTSEFGAFLDPIADKCLIVVTILCLVYTRRMHVVFAIPLVCRELFVLSLRQYSAERGVKINVSSGGKIKTAFQCFALGFAIVAPLESFTMGVIKNTLLFITTYFSISSFVQYVKLVRSLLS